MTVQGVYRTKSLKDDAPLGPIHALETNEKTKCGQEIHGPRWYYTHEAPTCKRCGRDDLGGKQ